jgi:hypothetical protein
LLRYDGVSTNGVSTAYELLARPGIELIPVDSKTISDAVARIRERHPDRAGTVSELSPDDNGENLD